MELTPSIRNMSVLPMVEFQQVVHKHHLLNKLFNHKEILETINLLLNLLINLLVILDLSENLARVKEVALISLAYLVILHKDYL
jgi:hypothetical protein